VHPSRNLKDLRKAVQLRRAGKKRQALALLFDLVRTEKTNPDVWFYLAVTLDNLSREAQAIPRYHRVLRPAPDYPRAYEVYLYLASAYQKTGRPEAAARYLAKARSLGRSDPLERQIARRVARDLEVRSRGDELPKGQVGSFYQNGKDGARWHSLAHFHAALRLKTGKFREKSGTGFQ
jgi:tetratricopeptide (TPR) repeat protein